MGNTSYNVSLRATRADSLGYKSKSAHELFSQINKRQIHPQMNPKAITIREARDSAEHPNSFPIILALDVTGSMGHIPLFFLREGLPKLIGKIIQSGFPDPALLLMAVGDSQNDSAPLQVGQFESGDAELDMWLERVWPEGGGGGNGGESYLLSWYFAALKTVTDSLERRGKKGILITIGDEPCLPQLTSRELDEFIEPAEKTYTDIELLNLAQEKYDVYHLHIMEGSVGQRSLSYWKQLLGVNCITVDDHTKSAEIIADLVLSSVQNINPQQSVKSDIVDELTEEPIEIL